MRRGSPARRPRRTRWRWNRSSSRRLASRSAAGRGCRNARIARRVRSNICSDGREVSHSAGCRSAGEPASTARAASTIRALVVGHTPVCPRHLNQGHEMEPSRGYSPDAAGPARSPRQPRPPCSPSRCSSASAAAWLHSFSMSSCSRLRSTPPRGRARRRRTRRHVRSHAPSAPSTQHQRRPSRCHSEGRPISAPKPDRHRRRQPRDRNNGSRPRGKAVRSQPIVPA